MSEGPPRGVLHDAAGQVVATYLPGRRTDHGVSRRWADDLEATADGDAVLGAVLRGQPGWVVSCDTDLGRRLVDAGAVQLRHAYVMTRSLADIDAAHGEDVDGIEPLLGVDPVDLLSHFRAAYPPGHPDHDPDDLRADALVVADAWAPYLREDGPLGPPIVGASFVLRDSDSGRVVASLLVNDREGEAPFGGPWVTYVQRDPDPRWAGAGSRLLRLGMHRLSEAGCESLSLAVTADNPAVRAYQRLGFVVAADTMTVVVPSREPARRVVLLAGPSGCGKSRLARASGLPVVALDHFYKNGDDPTLPRSADLGIVDWDDVRSWHAERAVDALESLCHEGIATIPLYDVARDGTYGSEQVDVRSAAAVVAEGIFAAEIAAACRHRGILLDSIVLTRAAWKNFLRRLARDLSQRRKPPVTLIRRGIGLMRAEPGIVARQIALGARPLDAPGLRRFLASVAGPG